jgi:hypothetical protein
MIFKKFREYFNIFNITTQNIVFLYINRVSDYIQ